MKIQARWYALTLGSLLCCSHFTLAGSDPFADSIVTYDPGSNATPGYVEPVTALGSPERISGELFGLSDVVSVFSPPYAPDEIVAVGAGGQITVKFDEPVINDPNNLYGIDLLVFGNTLLIDDAWPAGIVSGFLGNTAGTIEISPDGIQWHTIPNVFADALFPTHGYVDAGPYDHKPGSQPSDFTRPVDPFLSLNDFVSLDTIALSQLYRGSGGGVGIDLSDAGLNEISFVRISLPGDAANDILIDAFSDVSPRLPGDVTLNGVVDVEDLLQLINSWGPRKPGDPPADFDLDAVVDVDDLLTVINNWS